MNLFWLTKYIRRFHSIIAIANYFSPSVNKFIFNYRLIIIIVFSEYIKSNIKKFWSVLASIIIFSFLINIIIVR